MQKPQLISGIFIITFLLMAGTMAGMAVTKAGAGMEAARLKDVVNGRWALAYEHLFNKTLYMYDPSVTAWSIANYALFREGKEGVLVGGDGWLFTKEEFDYFPGQEKQIQKNLDFVARAHAALAQKDIRMIVAVVPAKARVYEKHLDRYPLPSYRAALYDRVVGDLRGRGIPVADLLQPLAAEAPAQDVFLKTDTHWTPGGAKVAAQAVAQAVRAQWPDLALETADFRTVERPGGPYAGDLLRYIPLGPLAHIGPSPDMITEAQTEKVEGPHHTAMANTGVTADALFSAETIPVALVGTSYSANPKWNFAGYLEENLQADVLNAAQEGQGPFETMEKYLSDASLNDNPPQLVIWEIPERYLPVAYDLKL